jgi:hypothetical protein
MNMNRSIAWTKKGGRVIVTVPKTKTSNSTILGTVSSYGVVNISVRCPKRAKPSKKREIEGAAVQSKSKGSTVTGHYFNFVATTLGVLGRHEQFKGHSLIHILIFRNTSNKEAMTAFTCLHNLLS